MKYDVYYLEEANQFLEEVDEKAKEKILYNISKAKVSNDKELFSKLNDTIYEFRTLFKKQKYRMLAFWDEDGKAFVICTHGFIKKTQKTPPGQIKHAENLRKQYLKL
jgi:phage-related protein